MLMSQGPPGTPHHSQYYILQPVPAPYYGGPSPMGVYPGGGYLRMEGGGKAEPKRESSSAFKAYSSMQ